MTRKMLTGAALLALTGLTGCFDSSSSNNSQTPRDELPIDFTAFVKNEVQKQAVDLEAVNINDLEFNFNDQDNEQAFDDLF